MSPKKASSLPPALSPDTSLAPRYKAGMHLELQKFGGYKGARQMLLSEAMREDGLAEDSAIEMTGLEALTVSEDKALSAIQILLDRTDYQGNKPGQQEASPEWRYKGPPLPRLAITYSDYFEAYGLQKMGDGGYYGHQADEALEALQSLTRTRRIIYERKRWEGQGQKRRQVSDIIRVDRPLISIARLYRGLEQEEAAQVRAGQDLPNRATMLLINVGPLLVDGLKDYFLLKPTTLHQEIRQIAAGRKGKKARESRAYSQFVELLLTVNLPVWPIAKDKLIEKLTSLDGYVRQRKHSKVDELLLEAIEIAQEAGYLLKWEEDFFGIYHFTLNPDRMGRPPKWHPKEGEVHEEAGHLPE